MSRNTVIVVQYRLADRCDQTVAGNQVICDSDFSKLTQVLSVHSSCTLMGIPSLARTRFGRVWIKLSWEQMPNGLGVA